MSKETIKAITGGGAKERSYQEVAKAAGKWAVRDLNPRPPACKARARKRRNSHQQRGSGALSDSSSVTDSASFRSFSGGLGTGSVLVPKRGWAFCGQKLGVRTGPLRRSHRSTV